MCSAAYCARQMTERFCSIRSRCPFNIRRCPAISLLLQITSPERRWSISFDHSFCPEEKPHNLDGIYISHTKCHVRFQKETPDKQAVRSSCSIYTDVMGLKVWRFTSLLQRVQTQCSDPVSAQTSSSPPLEQRVFKLPIQLSCKDQMMLQCVSGSAAITVHVCLLMPHKKQENCMLDLQS